MNRSLLNSQEANDLLREIEALKTEIARLNAILNAHQIAVHACHCCGSMYPQNDFYGEPWFYEPVNSGKLHISYAGKVAIGHRGVLLSVGNERRLYCHACVDNIYFAEEDFANQEEYDVAIYAIAAWLLRNMQFYMKTPATPQEYRDRLTVLLNQNDILAAIRHISP